MHTTLTLLLALTSPLLAQDTSVPSPAAELQALAPLVGSWDGKGAVVMAAGDDAGLPWTATIDAEWVLGGHALREVTHVDFGGAFAPMTMDTLYTFDRGAGRLAQVTASSMGGLEVAELVHSPAPGTLVIVSATMAEGAALVDRTTLTFTGDSLRYAMTRTSDAGAPFDHVTGTFARRTDGKRPVSAGAKRAETLAAELQPLKPFVGTYSIVGSWSPAPGAPAMAIRAVDEVTPMLGGQALAIATKGDAEGSPFVYEGLSWIAWNAAEGTFHQAWADNMGMSGHAALRAVGDGAFVSVTTGVEAGVPYTDRNVVRCEGGKLAHARTERLSGTAPAAVLFEAKYTAKD